MNQILRIDLDNEIDQKKQLNIKKLIAAIIVCVILMIVAIKCVYRLISINSVDKAIISDANEMMQMQQEELRKQEEARQLEEKKRLERYNPLKPEELEIIDKICEPVEQKRVFLTFDDGPSESVTPFILDLLKQENLKATFFVLGNNVSYYPEIVKREYEEGHFIGNHGTTHRYSEIYESVDTVLDEYNTANERIREAVGNPMYNSLVFRFPGGSFGGYYHDLKSEAKGVLREQGIGSVDWNALTNDSAGATTMEEIMDTFYATVEDKSSIVILMHDASDKILTYEALPEIIKYFRENGYEFKSLFDILDR